MTARRFPLPVSCCDEKAPDWENRAKTRRGRADHPMCRVSELIICFNIKSTGCDLVRRYGGKWSERRERINKSQRSGPYLFAPHECVSHRREKRLDAYKCVCMHVCIYIYTYIYDVYALRARKKERAGLTSRRCRCSHADFAAARGKLCTLARNRRDADYRWRDLIKHVDCFSAFMANFTLFMSTESYFLSRADWFM